MDEQSVPFWLRLWRYFRTKVRNAWWVLKTKGFRGVWRNVANEVLWLSGRYAVHQANTQASHGGEEGTQPLVPDSAFVNTRKVVPPSTRPTRSQIMPMPVPDFDRAAISQAISLIKNDIRHSRAIKGKLNHDDH